MECLSDFGTVSIFSVPTLTTGIYNSWLAFDDLNSANQISFILLIFILALLSIEIYSRKKLDIINQEEDINLLIRLNSREENLFLCLFLFDYISY